MVKESLVYEIEQQFREIEELKLMIRRPKNDRVEASYDYQKKLSGASTVAKLRERVEKTLGHSDFEILDENLNSFHGLAKLDAARKKQKHTLPTNEE